MKLYLSLCLNLLHCLAFGQAVRFVDPAGRDTSECINPGFPCLTITYALSQAASNDTIRIAEGIFTEPDGIKIDKSIVLQGAGKLETILQAHDELEMAISRVLTIDGEYAVSVIGVTIRHGNANKMGAGSLGGGMFCDSTSLILSDVRFIKNAAGISGGGLACASSTATCTDVDFDENMAFAQSGGGGGGGGLFLINSIARLTGVFFMQNSASWIGFGGGAFLLNAVVTIEHSGIVQNNASAGGGIFAGGGSMSLSNSLVVENNAGHNGGGGIYGNTDTLIIRDVTISGNQSNASGGGLYFSRGYQSLSNVHVRYNGASSLGGGGIYNSDCKPRFEEVVVEYNLSYGNGGGMINSTEYPYLLKGITFRYNEANESGGGLYHRGDSLILQDVLFEQNKAREGGGLFASGPTTLTQVTFLKNQATDVGGGLSFYGPLHLSGISFVENSATLGGGGMNSSGTFSDRKYPYLENVVFSRNNAQYGGGMSNGAFSYPLLEEVVFDSNSAEFGGGFYNSYGVPVFLNTLFEGNTASYGGGLYHTIDTVTAINTVFSSNVASMAGGAIYNSGDDNIEWMHGNIRLINATLVQNSAPIGAGIYNIYNSQAYVLNSIIWNNTGEIGRNIYNSEMSSAAFHYSLCGDSLSDVVKGNGIEFVNCLHDDPMFVNESDYRLTAISPCINSADPNTDPGLYPGGPVDPIDFDLNPRFVGSSIDMGAFEFQETVSVNADSEFRTSIYPNPSCNIVFIRGYEKIQNVSIYNLAGQLLWENIQVGWHDKVIDVSALPDGLYILNVVLDHTQAAFKILKYTKV